jgi:hypothetical protein
MMMMHALGMTVLPTIRGCGHLAQHLRAAGAQEAPD